MTSGNVLANRKNGTLSSVSLKDIDVVNELAFTVNYNAGVKLALEVTTTDTAIQTISSKAFNTVKAAKYIKNGKLVIVRDGKEFSVMGMEDK